MHPALRNLIVLRSDNRALPGLWIMDPTGKNRQYLGEAIRYDKEFSALRQQERLSPDGRYRLFVGDARPSAQIFIEQPKHPEYGNLPHKQLTFHTGLSYDPVWSPDGGRVAYVSQENTSDDIWLVYADGTEPRALTRNDWEWDKHPSWSPDGNQIVFWSNRSGWKQIYVMDADGSDVRNISNTEWDEYNPIWIK